MPLRPQPIMSKQEFLAAQAAGRFSPTSTYERYVRMRKGQIERARREFEAMEPGDRAALEKLFALSEQEDSQPQPAAA